MNITISTYKPLKSSDSNNLNKLNKSPRGFIHRFSERDVFFTRLLNNEDELPISEAISVVSNAIKKSDFSSIKQKFLNPDSLSTSFNELYLNVTKISGKIKLEVSYLQKGVKGSIAIETERLKDTTSFIEKLKETLKDIYDKLNNTNKVEA